MTDGIKSRAVKHLRPSHHSLCKHTRKGMSNTTTRKQQRRIQAEAYLTPKLINAVDLACVRSSCNYLEENTGGESTLKDKLSLRTWPLANTTELRTTE